MRHTPLVDGGFIVRHCGGDIRLKLENLQVTGSFKPRGAFIKMSSLSADERKQGLVAMSAGNHAQGVAYHAAKMGMPATIFMPSTTPELKIKRTQQYGVKIILEGNSLYEAEQVAMPFAAKHGLTVIHPYDDPMIVTGQASVFIEMINDWPDLEQIVVPVGGGGLASGIAIAAKAYNPNIKLIGVQSQYCQHLTKLIFPNKANDSGTDYVSSSETVAEGITVKNIGKVTSYVLGQYLDDMLLVKEEQIRQAVYRCATEAKLVVEGAGAAGVAAVLANPKMFKDKKTAVVICGGNIDPMILAEILKQGG